MELQDVERIARHALRDLGAPEGALHVMPETQPDRWRIVLEGAIPLTMNIRAGRGTSAQHVRDQIFEQFRDR
jgi:hypothetical protein